MLDHPGSQTEVIVKFFSWTFLIYPDIKLTSCVCENDQGLI